MEDNQIVPGGLTPWFGILAALLGLFRPELAAAVGAGGGVSAIIDEACRRREMRRVRRLETIVRALSNRVDGLENNTADDATVDLFLEVIKKAVDDDEERKSPIYAGVLEWIVVNRPTHAQVRVLSDAVHGLSYIELYFFLLEMNGQSSRHVVERELSEELVLSRIQAAGLASTGVRFNGNPTRLGSVLRQFVPLASLEAIRKPV